MSLPVILNNQKSNGCLKYARKVITISSVSLLENFLFSICGLIHRCVQANIFRNLELLECFDDT